MSSPIRPIPVVALPPRQSPPIDILFPLVHARRWLVSGVVGVVVVIVAGLLITHSTGGIDAIDLVIVHSISAFHAPTVDRLAVLIDGLLGPAVGTAVIIFTALVVWAGTRRWIVATTFLGVAAAPWCSAEVVKMVVQRDRPDPALLVDPLIIEAHNFSFPSGHTALAAGIALGMIFLARNNRWRAQIISLAIAGTVLVGGSRIWLGVHYPTDVIASCVLACAVVALILPPWMRLVDRFSSRRRSYRPTSTPGAYPSRERIPS